jgi:hypothetical protein
MTARELLSDILAIGTATMCRQRSHIRSQDIVAARQEAIRDYMEAIELRYGIHADGTDMTPRAMPTGPATAERITTSARRPARARST